MICIYCGRTIKYGATSCPHCKEKTGFDERFFYLPPSAPLPGADPDPEPQTTVPAGRPERKFAAIRSIFARRKKNKER